MDTASNAVYLLDEDGRMILANFTDNAWGQPIDRLRIAQAKVEGIAVVSGDSPFDACDVRRIWE